MKKISVTGLRLEKLINAHSRIPSNMTTLSQLSKFMTLQSQLTRLMKPSDYDAINMTGADRMRLTGAIAEIDTLHRRIKRPAFGLETINGMQPKHEIKELSGNPFRS